jgi:hypothetical protein
VGEGEGERERERERERDGGLMLVVELCVCALVRACDVESPYIQRLRSYCQDLTWSRNRFKMMQRQIKTQSLALVWPRPHFGP